jgi:hypothetical protein
MGQVLDYSAGFPGAASIRGAGYWGAVRYIGFPDRRKCTTADELADFTANGIGMALVHENTVTDWRGGYSAGQPAGQRARNHARSIGFPDHRPIYLAVDQDVVTSGEFGLMVDYLRGAGAAVGGPSLLGVYGEADAIDAARNAGVASYFWQTAAWSRGRRTSAHLFQHVGTVYVGGVACDVNDVLADDWGQHNYQGDDMGWDDNLKDWDAPQIEAPAKVWLIAGRKAAGQAADGVAHIQAQVAALTSAVSNGAVSKDEVLAAVREATQQTVKNSVLPALQEVVAEALGADNSAQADAIVTAMAERLGHSA